MERLRSELTCRDLVRGGQLPESTGKIGKLEILMSCDPALKMGFLKFSLLISDSTLATNT